MDQLCPACGLCCNGVLFADLALQQGDDFQRLKELGLKVRARGKLAKIVQPCACFDGKLCSIYKERPKNCRSFECGLLKRVQQRTQTVSEALQVIQLARRQARAVSARLRRLGNSDESRPLTRRYAAVMGEPIDLAQPDSSELRGQLARAVQRLMKTLQRHFLDVS